MAKKKKAKKVKKIRKKITKRKVQKEIAKMFEISIKLPKDVEGEDIRFYTLGKKLVVADKDWKCIKMVLLPFLVEREIKKHVKGSMLLLKMRKR